MYNFVYINGCLWIQSLKNKISKKKKKKSQLESCCSDQYFKCACYIMETAAYIMSITPFHYNMMLSIAS